MDFNILKIILAPSPLGWLLKNTIARRNLTALESALEKVDGGNDPETGNKLNDEQISKLKNDFTGMISDLIGNTNKQGWVLFVSIMLSSWYVYQAGADAALANKMLESIASGLTVAWFVITFASVKKLFLDSATVLTFLMLNAFTNAWMTIVIAIIVSPHVLLSEKVLIVTTIISAWAAAAVYDSLDLLRGNMDELAVSFYKKATTSSLRVNVDHE